MQKTFDLIEETSFQLREEDIRRYLIEHIAELQQDFTIVGKEFSVLREGRVDVLVSDANEDFTTTGSAGAWFAIPIRQEVLVTGGRQMCMESERRINGAGMPPTSPCRLREHAERNGWMDKLRYLLYEDQIVEEDAHHYAGLKGVLLQSKPDDNGQSRNPHIAALLA